MLVEQGNTCLMVDCGFSLRETEKRLHRLDKPADQITAILITHEHADHIHGVGALARKYGLTVWMTAGTWHAGRVDEIEHLRLFSAHEVFSINDIEITPFPVPHDARDPSQFVFSDGAIRLGVMTDLGSSTQHIEQLLNGVDALVLECNHESDLLANGSYPVSLKRRVGGHQGHLSNMQSAELLTRIDHSRLRHIVAAHLSEKHNLPQLAGQALCGALDCALDWIGIADQELGLDWRQI